MVEEEAMAAEVGEGHLLVVVEFIIISSLDGRAFGECCSSFLFDAFETLLFSNIVLTLVLFNIM